MSKICDTVMAIAICALIAGNLTYAVYVMRPRLGLALYEQNAVFPHISGVLYDGSVLQVDPMTCVLLRVTSDSCPHCREDKSRYGQLRQSARSVHCKILEVSPRTGQIKGRSDPDVAQMKFVDMQLGAALIPYETPETIVLDNARRVVWVHEGSLDDSALSTAVKSLRRLR